MMRRQLLTREPYSRIRRKKHLLTANRCAMPDVDEVRVIYGIPVFPHDLPAVAEVFIPRPRIVNLQPALWRASDEPEVLPFPARDGPRVAGDPALHRPIGIDLSFRLRPVRTAVECGCERLVGQRLIARDLVGIRCP